MVHNVQKWYIKALVHKCNGTYICKYITNVTPALATKFTTVQNHHGQNISIDLRIYVEQTHKIVFDKL